MFAFIDNPVFYVVAIPAVLIAGIGKGGFGGSIGMLATPLMALAITPVQAAAVMLPILCAMDIFGVLAYRKTASWRNLAIMAPGAIVGIVVGAVSFDYLSDDIIRILVGMVALVFAFNQILRRHAVTRPAPVSRLRGGFWAMVSGFTSFIAHAGGPPVQVYLLPQRLDRTIYVGTTVWFFLLVNYVKIIPYGLLGQFSAQNLGTSLILAPLAPLGIWLGIKVHNRINEGMFYRIIHAFLIVVGLKLFVDGISSLAN